MARSFQPLDALLGRVLREPRILAAGGRIARLRAAWTEVVGGPIAAHTEASHLQGKALVVHVDNAGWLTELNFRRAELLQQIHAWAEEGWPAEVRLVLHPLEATPDPEPEVAAPPPPSPARRRAAAAATAEVEDEALREVIARALEVQHTDADEPDSGSAKK